MHRDRTKLEESLENAIRWNSNEETEIMESTI